MPTKLNLLLHVKNQRNSAISNSNISIEDKQIPIFSTVKYIGFFLDQNFTLQQEVKNVPRKMACGIKTLNAIKIRLNINTFLVIMNAFVRSHLHYASIILISTTRNLVASGNQQLNWAKLCFNRRKFYSLRISYFNIAFYRSDTFWTSNSYVTSGGCHKIHFRQSKPCHYLLQYCLKIKELVNWIVKLDIELPFLETV